MLYKRILVAVLIPLLFGISAASGQEPVIGEIKKSLVCLCDCGMIVEACEGSMACQSAEKLTVEARGYIDQGLSKEAVLSKFVGNYGEHILAAPTKKGFNLTAWILPFAAIILAGLGITVVLRRWSRRSGTEETGAPIKGGVGTAALSKYEVKLDDVLRRLD